MGCLAPGTESGALAKVVVEQKGEKFALAWLREGKTEFCALDLFLESSEAKLSVQGKATVHLTGYFEAEEDDDDMDDAPAPKTGKTSPAAKAAAKKEAEDDEEDEEEEEEEEE